MPLTVILEIAVIEGSEQITDTIVKCLDQLMEVKEGEPTPPRPGPSLNPSLNPSPWPYPRCL